MEGECSCPPTLFASVQSQVLLLGSAWEPAAKFRRELWSQGMQSPGSAGETEPGLGPGVFGVAVTGVISELFGKINPGHDHTEQF